MKKRPRTGEIWEFTSYEGDQVYFLVGDIAPRDRVRPERATLILICDTTEDNNWRNHNLTHDSTETMVVSHCWRKVS